MLIRGISWRPPWADRRWDLSLHTIAGAIQRVDPMTFEMLSKAKPAGDWTELPIAIRQLQQSW